ncbi:MAG: hypothetical protein WCC97_08430 [Candidatus Acidiferrales bacterium]
MPSYAVQDAHNIKRQISYASTPLAERCRLCELLIELYPSRRHRQFVNAFIRKYPAGAKYGLVFDLKMKINAEKIAAHREKILANRKAKELAKQTGTPVGTVAVAPGDDGHEYYVDKDGNVLGRVPEQVLEQAPENPEWRPGKLKLRLSV